MKKSWSIPLKLLTGVFLEREQALLLQMNSY